MIPILYSGSETSFTSNGLGRLTDIIECTCTEERNGIYEVEFTYPVTGKFYQQMVNMVEAHATGNWNNCGVIGCIHDDRHDIQPFDLYSVSSPIDGVATFNAHHISYRLGREIVVPFSATSAADAISQLPLKIKGGSLFTFWTDKATGGSMELKHPENVRNILGGQEGSILDSFGTGEYEFDKFAVKLYQNRGVNTGATIRYGKNMTDITRDIDSSGSYNAVAPYWTGQVTDESTQETRDAIVYLSEVFVKAPDVTGDPIVAALDVSGDFQEIPTQNELKARALQYLNENKPWVPKDNIKVSFVQLWQTEEYKDVAILQRLSICDQINVYYEALGVVAEEQEVIRVVYNVLLERYDEMELGEPETSLASSLSSETMAQFESELEKAKKAAVTSSMLQAAIKHATDLITGGLGGHVVFTLNADGKPEEILIMDTDDPNTAVNVWRFNKNGLGHSHNGYNGPFSDVALTADGAINAALITTGTMLANIIKGGTLSLGGANNGNGVMRVCDASGNETVVLDNTGFQFTGLNYYPEWAWSEGYATVPSYRYNLKHYKKRTRIEDGSLNFYSALAWNNRSAIANPSFIKYASLSQNGQYYVTLATLQNNVGVLLKSYDGAHMTVGGKYDPAGNEVNNDEISFGSNVRLASARGILFGGLYDNSGYIYKTRNYGKIIGGSFGNLVLSATGSSSGHSGTCTLTIKPEGIIETSSQITCWSLYISNGLLDVVSIECINLTVNGSKSRAVDTKDFGDRLLYCYEMPSPMFGDIGESVINDDGLAYIFLDPIFEEAIDTDASYQVFLQKYGEGDLWIYERKPGYFVVKGTPGLNFAWELKAKQFDASNVRMESKEIAIQKKEKEIDYEREAESYLLEVQRVDYGANAADYIQELEEERMSIE